MPADPARTPDDRRASPAMSDHSRGGSGNWLFSLSRRERRTLQTCFLGWAPDAVYVQIHATVMPTRIALWRRSEGLDGVIAASAVLVSSLVRHLPVLKTHEAARPGAAVSRYPRPKTAEIYEPAGRRGDGPASECRYRRQEYYGKADAWPLHPRGEVLVFILCESLRGVANSGDILRIVPGISCVLIGEGDLSQELGKRYKACGGPSWCDFRQRRTGLGGGFPVHHAVPVRKYDAIEKAREIA